MKKKSPVQIPPKEPVYIKSNTYKPKFTPFKKPYQQYLTIKNKISQPHSQLHPKAPVKQTAVAPENLHNKPIYKINLLDKDLKVELPPASCESNAEQEENAEFNSEDESCAHKIQALSRRPHPCPSKEKTTENFNPELTDNSLILTEEDSNPPILKKEYIHNVPLSSNGGNMNQYLMRTKALGEVKTVSKISLCFKKVLIKDYLLKKSKGSWKSKYCILRHKTFVYFNNKGNCRVKGCLQFNSVSCRLRHVINSNEFEYR